MTDERIPYCVDCFIDPNNEPARRLTQALFAYDGDSLCMTHLVDRRTRRGWYQQDRDIGDPPIVDVSTYDDGIYQRYETSAKLTFAEAQALGLTEPPTSAEDEAELRAKLLDQVEGGSELERKYLPLLDARLDALEGDNNV